MTDVLVQTFGGVYESDGRLEGTEDVRSVACPDGVCAIRVPAPGFALVSLAPSSESPLKTEPTRTFSTTASVKAGVSVTLDPGVLETSNGRKRAGGRFGRTTRGRGELLVSASGRNEVCSFWVGWVVVVSSVLVLVL